MAIVYLNGQFMDQSNATVSIMDRGFLFGDGVYEVIPVYQGKIFHLDKHLQRLEHSLRSIHIPAPYELAQWQQILTTLLEKNEATKQDLNIYIQITRGPAPTRTHAFPQHIHPTIVAFLMPPRVISDEALAQGMAAITAEDTRQHNNHIKSTSLLSNIMHAEAARAKDAAETLLIREGNAVEGATSNLFIVKKGVIITPPLAPTILSGITREVIVDLAKQHHIPLKEQIITEKMLRSADEIWISSSTREIYPITKLDGKIIGNGQAGPLWHKMHNYFAQFKTQLLEDAFIVDSKLSAKESLITYPCDFTLKVMGKATPAFEKKILAIVKKHYPKVTKKHLQKRYSKDNNYVSLSITVHAQNQNELDELYRELTACPEVLMAL